jgi:hypothetical protein
VALDIVLAPLALAPKTFSVGDKVRVTASFKYVVGVNTTVKLFAGPYYTNIFGRHMVTSCVGQADASLTAASAPTSQTALVDFILIPKANGGIDNGTYGLRVWIEGTSAVAEQDDVLIVTGNPSGGGDVFTGMMPVLMMLMMMGMVMPMVTEGMGEGEQ